MAAVTLTGTPSLATTRVPDSCRISGLLAGEAIPAGHLCYIKSDGLVWKSNGTSANAAAKVRGMALVAAQVGEAVTLYHDVDVRYGAGLTPGAELYLSTTAGLIEDAATTGGSASIGYVKSATVIHVFQSRY
jgi:hypothetical protein